MSSKDTFNTMLVDIMPRLKSYAIWLTRNQAAADDLLQETAHRALRARAQFTMGTNFTAWIFRILRNEFYSSLRRGKRTPLAIDDLPENVFTMDADQEDIVFTGQVIRTMDRLRPGQRQILELICAAGMSYDEAAESIDCSIGTVKSRLWRARQQMDVLLHSGKPGLRHKRLAPSPLARAEFPGAGSKPPEGNGSVSFSPIRANAAQRNM